MGHVIDSYKKDAGFEKDFQDDSGTIKAYHYEEKAKPSKNEAWSNDDKSSTSKGEMKEETVPGKGSPANKEDRPLEHAEPITPHFLRQVEIVLDILKDGQGEKSFSEASQNQPNNNSSSN